MGAASFGVLVDERYPEGAEIGGVRVVAGFDRTPGVVERGACHRWQTDAGIRIDSAATAERAASRVWPVCEPLSGVGAVARIYFVMRIRHRRQRRCACQLVVKIACHPH